MRDLVKSYILKNHLGSCESSDSGSVGSEWGLDICISNVLPGAPASLMDPTALDNL